jgi:hypothetical protein
MSIIQRIDLQSTEDMHTRCTSKTLWSKILSADVARRTSYRLPLTRTPFFDSRDRKTTIFTDATYTWRSQVGSCRSCFFFLESQHGRAHDIASLERYVTRLHTAPFAAQKSYGISRTTGRRLDALIRMSVQSCLLRRRRLHAGDRRRRLDAYTVMCTRSEPLALSPQ